MNITPRINKASLINGCVSIEVMDSIISILLTLLFNLKAGKMIYKISKDLIFKGQK